MDMKSLLEYSVKHGASDLHLSAGLKPMVRIDGELVNVADSEVLDAESTQRLIYSIMDEDQQKQIVDTLEMDFAISIPNLSHFRVNAFNQINGMAAVFRTISSTVPTLDDLELPPIFKDLLDLPNGLILVTGPTGSGKSTTLAAMIDYINRNQAVHIITVEDPIEYVYQSKTSLINQRQVHRDTHDFATALRSALREDPDVILVGEMRDLETIRLALTAAETGHLVMATLHTSSAPRSISRIVDVFSAAEKDIIRNMLSESLQAVICQSLVKKIPEGRIPAFEIMIGTSAIRNLIREDRIAQMYSAIQTGSEKGMCTLDQYLQKLVVAEKITKETARSVAVNKDQFI
ncbi:MAG: type IV pilus twitching motility protein PilT [Gammaproteobacteria bacterium]|nr:type IV pilus twitching motility protein PilT [Gammaproteobacteria bacterium]